MRYLQILTLVVLFILPLGASAQKPADTGFVKSSSAYAEILLRRTELQANLEALAESYTQQNPKVLDIRYELSMLDKSLERMNGTKAAESSKLTLALGKLLVQKAALETDLSRLSRNYSKDHPEVRRAKRKVEIFENAISEVL